MNELFRKGKQGKTLRVPNGSVRVERIRFFLRPPTKVLPPRHVSSVEVKRPGVLAGFVQFSIEGGIARDSGYSLSGGATDAVRNFSLCRNTPYTKYLHCNVTSDTVSGR